MTQVFPISSATTTTPKPTTTSSSDNSQINQDTFLQLLVAQLKYQDPMSPMDSTQFVTQSATFTELETLQKIETEQESQAQSGQLLSAATMVGRTATYNLQAAGQSQTPTATSAVSIRGTLPKDAPTGTHATATTSVFTTSGQNVPLTLDFVKTDSGWDVQPKSNSFNIGPPISMSFDASGDHTSNDLTIASSDLDTITGTSGTWPPGGMTLAFGDSNDPTRLQLADGPATVAVAEQNGNDGNTAAGVVTGIHITADGPKLVIGGQEIPLASITDVQS